jgi:hypothetical protein
MGANQGPKIAFRSQTTMSTTKTTAAAKSSESTRSGSESLGWSTPGSVTRLARLRAGVDAEWRALYAAAFDTILVTFIAAILAFGCHLHLCTVKGTRDDFRSLQDEADRVAGQAAAIAAEHEDRNDE